MIRLLVILLLAGCSSGVKHETRSLLCVGFCSETNVKHNVKGKQGNEANDQASGHPSTGDQCDTDEC